MSNQDNLSVSHKEKIVGLFHSIPMPRLLQIAELLKSSKNWQCPIVALELSQSVDWPVVQGLISKALISNLRISDQTSVDDDHVQQLERLSEFAQYMSQAEANKQVAHLSELR
jgi:hypothetical protein